MQLLCFFDLPTQTRVDRRNYCRFRKFLLRLGFSMVEESVYGRMVINGNSMKAITDAIRAHRPPDGVVALLPVTEKQFSNMEFIVGDTRTDVIHTKERVVEV